MPAHSSVSCVQGMFDQQLWDRNTPRSKPHQGPLSQQINVVLIPGGQVPWARCGPWRFQSTPGCFGLRCLFVFVNEGSKV